MPPDNRRLAFGLAFAAGLIALVQVAFLLSDPKAATSSLPGVSRGATGAPFAVLIWGVLLAASAVGMIVGASQLRNEAPKTRRAWGLAVMGAGVLPAFVPGFGIVAAGLAIAAGVLTQMDLRGVRPT